MSSTREGRRWLVAQYGFLAFCLIYLKHHFSEPLGLVHHIIMNNIADQKLLNVAITSFRDCGKTTICTLAYPVFAILEKKIKFMVLISDTGVQTELMIESIKDELGGNELIFEDYGNVAGEYWGKTELQTKEGIKVLGRSSGQKVRGLKFRENRPDLIICDDPETSEDVRTSERRAKTYRWFFHEVYPARNKRGGRIFYIGNWLHSECLLAKLQQKPNWISQHIAVTHNKADDGVSMWSARFPNTEAILKEKEGHDPILWAREYMLKPVAEEGQIIEAVTQYADIPGEARWISSGVGIDLAISKKQTADYTAFVRGDLYEYQDKFIIYITRTHHARIGLRETITYAKEIGMNPDGSYSTFFVEKVAYQQACIEEMEREFLPVYGITTGTQDKRARLHGVAPMIKSGQVQFPLNSANDLILQVTGFGIEAHDDLMDALVHLLRGIQKVGLQTYDVKWL